MPPQHSRRGAVYRSVCLAVGALCLLAALAAAAGRPGTTGQHRSHVLATAAVGYDLQGMSHRAGLDAVPAGRAAARTSAARLAASVGVSPEPRRSSPETVRTRGPPVPA